jgi:hypothetical protein
MDVHCVFCEIAEKDKVVPVLDAMKTEGGGVNLYLQLS